MTLAEPCGLSRDRQERCLDQPSPLPIMPTEAMVRQAEVDAEYLAVEAARADPLYQADLRARATEARERAHQLRAAMAGPMTYDASPGNLDPFESAPEALA